MSDTRCPVCGPGVIADAGGICRSCGKHAAACDTWEGECNGCDWHLLMAALDRVAELERRRTTALKLIDFSRDQISLGGAMALDALLTIEAALRGDEVPE